MQLLLFLLVIFALVMFALDGLGIPSHRRFEYLGWGLFAWLLLTALPLLRVWARNF